MLLIDPLAMPRSAEELAGEAADVSREVAETGLRRGLVQRGVQLADEAALLARSLRGQMPEEAVALLEAVRRLDNALRERGRPAEDAVLDALDAVHIALLAVQENGPVAGNRPLRDIVNWMTETLGVTQEQFANAVGVPPRTLQRWLAGVTPTPRATEDRLRLVLRGLNEVRFALRGPLALAWLKEPLRAAGDRAPLDILDQPDAFQRAVMATRF
jgi:hypothetical protein